MHSLTSRGGRRSLAFTLIAVTSVSAACAQPRQFSNSFASRTGSSLTLQEARLSATTQTITRAELGKVSANSAWDVVVRLRPRFLRREYNGIDGTVEPIVYIDDAPIGPPSILRDIAVDTVAEIRYVTPAEAFTQHGPRHQGGMIVVRMRR